MIMGCLLWMAVFGISAAVVWCFGWIPGIIAFVVSFTAAAFFAGGGDDDGEDGDDYTYYVDYE